MDACTTYRLPIADRDHRRHRLAAARGGGGQRGQRHRDRCRAASSGSASRWCRPLRLLPSAVGRDQRTGGIAHPSSHPRRRGQSHPAVHRRHPRQRSRGGQRAALRTAQCRPGLADRARARAAIGPVGIGGDRRGDCGQRQRRTGDRRDGAGRRRVVRISAGRPGRRRWPATRPASRWRSAGSSARRASTASTATATATAIRNAARCGRLARWAPSPSSNSARRASGSTGGASSTGSTRSPSCAPTRSTNAQSAGRRAALARSLARRSDAWRGKLSASAARIVATATSSTASEINRTRGRRSTSRGRSSTVSPPASVDHALIVAVE